MIITISGDLGSGKSTVAQMLAKELDLTHYSTGDLMREMAAQRNLSILELNKLTEEKLKKGDREIDDELDNRQKELGLTSDNFVIDGRLSFHFIPQSTKIFLKVEAEEGAKRIMNAKRATENGKSVEELMQKAKDRQASELSRYKKLYNVDYTDEKNYDLIIDTTSMTAEQVKDKIKEFLEKE